MAYLNTRYKNIQYGTIVLSGADLSEDAALTAVDWTKAELHLLGQTTTVGSGGGVPMTANLAYLTKVDSTTIRATRGSIGNSSGGNVTTTVSYMVTERHS